MRPETSRSENGTREYRRPVVANYTFADGEGKYAGQDVTIAPIPTIIGEIERIVGIESPVHQEELIARLVGLWETRAGSRISASLARMITRAERSWLIVRRGEFLWSTSAKLTVRSRSGTQMHADRIAPEEYEATVRLILADGHAMPRQELVMEVRSVLGFNRTGNLLEAAINSTIDKMFDGDELGEVSSGICRRQ